MTRSGKALQAFAGGANCAQSVLLAFAEEYGLDAEKAMAISRGFGSGMATASICGAVSGGVMVIGLASGIGVDNSEAKPRAYRMVQDFSRRFRERHGSLVCRELIGCDVSDPVQLKAAREKGLFTRVCAPLIRDAVEMVEKIATNQSGGENSPPKR